MPYRPTYKQEMDDLIELLVPQAPRYASIAELSVKGFRKGAVRAALRRLVAVGLVTRAWHVKGRSGYAVYFITPTQGE